MDEGARPDPTTRVAPDEIPPGGTDRRLRPPTLRVALLIGAAIIVATVLYLARSSLGPFILGLFLVYLLDPAVSVLERRVRLPRWLAILLLYVAIVLGFILILRITLPPLIEQVTLLVSRFPELMQGWIAALEQAIAGLELLPEGVRAELIRVLEEYSESLAGGLAGGGAGLSELFDWLLRLDIAGPLARAVTAFFAYLVIPIFVFYLLKDRAALSEALHRAMPMEWQPDVRAVTTIVDRVFGRWLRGQLLLGLVVGLATFAGLVILSFVIDPVFGEFAVLLAILAGLLELVPIIGPIIAAIPIILIGATAGIEGALAAFLLALGIQQVENNFLVPKIQGDATDLHPAIVIAGIVIGGSIGGILGAILALPVSAAFRDVIRYLFRRLAPVPDDPPTALAAALRPATWRVVAEAAEAAETAATVPSTSWTEPVPSEAASSGPAPSPAGPGEPISGADRGD